MTQEATGRCYVDLAGALARAQESDDRREERAWWKARYGPRFQPAERTCLGPLCRGRIAFASAHAGERLCPRCRKHIADLYRIQADQL